MNDWTGCCISVLMCIAEGTLSTGGSMITPQWTTTKVMDGMMILRTLINWKKYGTDTENVGLITLKIEQDVIFL